MKRAIENLNHASGEFTGGRSQEAWVSAVIHLLNVAENYPVLAHTCK